MRRKETVGAPVPSKADLHRVTTEEKLFHSDYNVPPGHAPAQNEVRWALRGYLPPKHLRIDGYNYGLPEDSAVVFADASPNIVKRESTTALMAGCFVPDSEAEMDVGAQSETSHACVTLGASPFPRAPPRDATHPTFFLRPAARDVLTRHVTADAHIL